MVNLTFCIIFPINSDPIRENKTESQTDMEAAEVLQLYELRYSDLVLVSSNEESLSSAGELERAESTSKAIMEALGPAGPGLLAITGVPKSASLRRALLPLARKLALLNPNHRKGILKVLTFYFS